jgi:bifunctional non-homologous end joining protein LigD
MVRLECTSGGHNKFYEFNLVRSSGRVRVLGYYGAIGQAPKETVIYDGNSESDARKELDKKQNEKLKKGYQVTEAGKDITASKVPDVSKDSVTTIWPMNAQGVDDEEHLKSLLASPDFTAQEKLDGMRAVIHITEGGLRIFSRSAGVADPFHPLEKTSSLPHLAGLTFPTLIGTVLDAEILAPGKDCATNSGMINSKNGSNSQVKAFVFDLIQLCGQDWTKRSLSQRVISLNHIAHNLRSPFIEILPYATSPKAKQELYAHILGNGSEGMVLKNLGATYVQGARPANNWFKWKKSSAFDCVCIGFTKGAGKYNTLVGAVRFGQYVRGELVELGQASGFSDEVRREMTLYPKRFIGKVVSIKGQERLKSGAIRHPVYVGIRNDRQPKDCVWYPNEQ